MAMASGSKAAPLFAVATAVTSAATPSRIRFVQPSHCSPIFLLEFERRSITRETSGEPAANVDEMMEPASSRRHHSDYIHSARKAIRRIRRSQRKCVMTGSSAKARVSNRLARPLCSAFGRRCSGRPHRQESANSNRQEISHTDPYLSVASHAALGHKALSPAG